MLQPEESAISQELIIQEEQEFLAQYEIGKILSAPDEVDNASIVKSAKHKTSKLEVAIKIISKVNQSEQKIARYRQEIVLLDMCNHDGVIKLVDSFESKSHIYIVMEKATGGDLFTYLEKRDFELSEEEARPLCFQLATIVQYLHQLGIAHRDIKPDNILISSSKEPMRIKLSDFEFATKLVKDETVLEHVGTLTYMAPEILLKQPHSKEVDIFSLGVVFYMLLSGILPFDDDQDSEIVRQTIHDSPDFTDVIWKSSISVEARELVKKLLKKDRNQRPGIDEILSDPWFCKQNRVDNF